jgi:hypothetical protein
MKSRGVKCPPDRLLLLERLELRARLNLERKTIAVDRTEGRIIRKGLDLNLPAVRLRYGLIPLENARDAANHEWKRAWRRIALTKARSIAGLVVKLQVLDRRSDEGLEGTNEKILKSAIADARRLAAG